MSDTSRPEDARTDSDAPPRAEVPADALSTDAVAVEATPQVLEPAAALRSLRPWLAERIEENLFGAPGPWRSSTQSEPLRRAIITKNEWFFHRSRPANMAYIFGFRKREQGRNAAEVVKFDEFIAVVAICFNEFPAVAGGSKVGLPPAETENIFLMLKTAVPAGLSSTALIHEALKSPTNHLPLKCGGNLTVEVLAAL